MIGWLTYLLSQIVGKAFENQLKYSRKDLPSRPTLDYEAFDFHKECANMKFENVNKLMDSLDARRKAMGYTWLDVSV